MRTLFGVRNLAVIFFGLLVPTILVLWLGLKWLPLGLLVGSAAGVVIFLWREGCTIHEKEIAATCFLLMFSASTALLPIVSIREHPVRLGQAEYPGSEQTLIWHPGRATTKSLCLPFFPQGTPCKLTFVGEESDTKSFMILDRFTVWEYIAIIQTLGFAVIIWLELWVTDRFKASSATLIVFLFVITIVGYWFKVHREQYWTAHLFVTPIFALSIFIVDYKFWLDEKKRIFDNYNLREGKSRLFPWTQPQLAKLTAEIVQSANMMVSSANHDKPEIGREQRLVQMSRDWIDYNCATRIAWCTDAVGVVSVFIICLCAVGLGVEGPNGSPYDEAQATVFFAGGTAISLMFSNLSLVVLRIMRHLDILVLERGGVGPIWSSRTAASSER